MVSTFQLSLFNRTVVSVTENDCILLFFNYLHLQ